VGGGVGISIHAPFQVATENTIFAMPETKIGYFPDSGSGFFLSRMDGELGVYLGLTSQQLKAVDVLYSGVATHYVPSARLGELEHRLASLPSPVTHDQVNRTIESCTADLDDTSSSSITHAIRDTIDR
jgi:3-hydroxyisobutyryl-CoA hydrolase